MKIEGNVLTADEGKAIRRKGDEEPSTIRRVALTDGDSTDNWEDCFYGIPKKYSTLSIKRALAKLVRGDGETVWKKTKTLLQDADYWDDFILANYLNETDGVFKTACEAIVAKGIVSSDELGALLPDCLWTP